MIFVKCFLLCALATGVFCSHRDNVSHPKDSSNDRPRRLRLHKRDTSVVVTTTVTITTTTTTSTDANSNPVYLGTLDDQGGRFLATVTDLASARTYQLVDGQLYDPDLGFVYGALSVFASQSSTQIGFVGTPQGVSGLYSRTISADAGGTVRYYNPALQQNYGVNGEVPIVALGNPGDENYLQIYRADVQAAAATTTLTFVTQTVT